MHKNKNLVNARQIVAEFGLILEDLQKIYNLIFSAASSEIRKRTLIKKIEQDFGACEEIKKIIESEELPFIKKFIQSVESIIEKEKIILGITEKNSVQKKNSETLYTYLKSILGPLKYIEDNLEKQKKYLESTRYDYLADMFNKQTVMYDKIVKYSKIIFDNKLHITQEDIQSGVFDRKALLENSLNQPSRLKRIAAGFFILAALVQAGYAAEYKEYTQSKAHIAQQSVHDPNMLSEMQVFKEALNLVLKLEGGVSNNKNDPGGLTNLGVTQKTYSDYLLKNGQKARSVSNITSSEAESIYYKLYWQAGSCHKIKNPAIQIAHFQASVNIGVSEASKCLQRALYSKGYKLTIDGKIGNQTLSSLEDVLSKGMAKEILDLYFDFQGQRYEKIISNNPKLAIFQKGWENRIKISKAWIFDFEQRVEQYLAKTAQESESFANAKQLYKRTG